MNDNPVPETPNKLLVTFTMLDMHDNPGTYTMQCHLVELHCSENTVTVMFYNLKPQAGGYSKHLVAVRTRVVSIDTEELTDTEQVAN